MVPKKIQESPIPTEPSNQPTVVPKKIKTRYVWFATKIILGLILSVWLLEAIAEKKNWEIRPSYFENIAKDWIYYYMRYAGEWVAWVTSFLTFFEFHILIISARKLLAPLIDICFSWKEFIGGYAKYALSYTEPYMVYIGTILSVIVGISLFRRYGVFGYIDRKTRLFTTMNKIIMNLAPEPPRSGVIMNES